MLKPVEDAVDGAKRLQLDIGLDLALCGESQSLCHVFAVANKRAADGDAIGHNIK